MSASPIEQIIYRIPDHGEIAAIVRLMEDVFNDFIAPGYDPEGIDQFFHYIRGSAIALRLKRNHFVRVAATSQKIVGVIEVRNYNHISLLFVTREFQRQGIAKILMQQAIAVCLREKPDLRKITVHADPRALPAYKAMGFKKTGSERLDNGIRYVPMQYKPRKYLPLIQSD
ncbi:MAG: GNAT family N-acetyltransferase [Limnothrix sp. RL_2_0]|nr:GNAT family N-acetyltransferase [Limnothrix sp. RL_2_0]